MPYKTNDQLPLSVRSVLPKHAQDIFRAAFNAALETYDGDEEKARMSAWSAVKKKYRRPTKAEGGKMWVKKAGVEEGEETVLTEEPTEEGTGGGEEEMELTEELSQEQRREVLDHALRDRFAPGDDGPSGIWVIETYDNEVIFEWDNEYFRIEYEFDDEDNVTLASTYQKVERRVEYVAATEERQAREKGIEIGKDLSLTDTTKKPNKSAREGYVPRKPILTLVEDMELLEETVDPASGSPLFRYRGVALIDGIISKGNAKRHPRFYSEEFNNRAMVATNEYMAGGGVVTVYSRHGKAVPAADGSLPTGLPIGKVDRDLYRKDGRVMYEARVSDTTEGVDVMKLIRDGVMKHSSVRTYDYTSRPGKVNGRPVEIMVGAVIHGIDLAETAGIEGAVIETICEGDAEITFEEVNEMDLKTLTLEELRKERPDLVESLEREVATEELQAKVVALEGDHKVLVEKHTAELGAKDAEIARLNGIITEAAANAAITQAAQGKPYATLLEEVLRFGFPSKGQDGQVAFVPGCKSPAEVTERLATAEAHVADRTKLILEESQKTTIMGQIHDPAGAQTYGGLGGSTPESEEETLKKTVKQRAAGT